MSLTGFFFRVFYEWAARSQSYDTLLEKLERNQEICYDRLVNAAESAFNRSRAIHVIGIERWGTRRLTVALGEPLVMDEYDGYAPSEQLSMEELGDKFLQTRAATIAVVRELKNKSVPISQTVRHNEVGDLSIGGWIYYLDNHMWRETVPLELNSRRKQRRESEA